MRMKNIRQGFGYSRLRFLLALFRGTVAYRYIVFCGDRFSGLETYARRFPGKNWGNRQSGQGWGFAVDVRCFVDTAALLLLAAGTG